MAELVPPGVQKSMSGVVPTGTRPLDAEVLAEVAARRSRLLEAMRDLESQLASAARPGWGDAVTRSLDSLRLAFVDHVDETERAGGLYSEIRRSAPRLIHQVDRLGGEHPAIVEALDDLATALGPDIVQATIDPTWVDQVRHEGTHALSLLSRHRQRGADLVYEAFERDLGGFG